MSPLLFPLNPSLYQFVFSLFTSSLPLASFHPPALSLPPPVLHMPPISLPASLVIAAAGFNFCMPPLSQVEPCACVHVYVCKPPRNCVKMINLFFSLPSPPHVTHFHSHKGLNLSEMSGVLSNSQLLASLRQLWCELKLAAHVCKGRFAVVTRASACSCFLMRCSVVYIPDAYYHQAPVLPPAPHFPRLTIFLDGHSQQSPNRLPS